MTQRPIIVAGNWKMYKTIEESIEFVQKLELAIKESARQVYLAVPFTAIKPVAEAAAGTKIIVGAQNMNDAREGAFTGEIAARMLVDAGAKFVILGHSERRKLFGETSEFINKKVKRAFIEGLQSIVCIGETWEERESGKTEKILEEQFGQTLSEISEDESERLILAYEPVWAIGTGRTATPLQAEQMHQFCRDLLSKKWGTATAEKIVILYGGSVRPENVAELIEQPNIDGVLVGGASLSVESFSEMVNYQTITKIEEVS
jgi:triosephosphate isomerase